MKIPHDKFCVLPWISLEASPVGTVRPCCLAEDEIVDSDSVKFNLNTADFADIQNSEYMYQLRQAFLNHGRPATCRKCWDEESAGRTSKRMHTLDRLKHIIGDTEWTHDAKPLMFLDLKLGNICNLKCRICGSWSSSQCATEEIQNTPVELRKETFAYQMLRAGAWPRENQSFWNEIDQCLDNIRYIEFTGGEPFLIQEHFDMLQGIVDRGIARQVEIHYNTNGTQYPEHAEGIWRHFKTVEIAFSIDDLGSRFEYQRSNAVWTEVIGNIKLFKEMRARNKNITLQCCSTVNIFNVVYLVELAQWIDQQGFDFVYWNMLHEIWYFSIASLPSEVKLAIAQRLIMQDIPERHLQEFGRIVDFMRNGRSSNGTDMLNRIQELDQLRNQNLRAVAPELADLIGYDKT